MAKIELNGLTGQILLNEEPVIDLNTFEQDKSLMYKSIMQYGTDLNDLTGTGIYHQIADASAATGFNFPEAKAGVLTVLADDGYVYQNYHVAGDSDSVYFRSLIGASWSTWKKVPSIDDTTPSDESAYSSNKTIELLDNKQDTLVSGTDIVTINGDSILAANNLELVGGVVVVLGSNVVNNNAVANTLQDVTGLSFPVVTGGVYRFTAYIAYNAAVTTTGSRWTINGPAASLINFKTEYTLTATTQTINYQSAYLLPNASNASSLTTGNSCTIDGIVSPTADGTIQIQFASEVASSAITALAGSYLIYQKLA